MPRHTPVVARRALAALTLALFVAPAVASRAEAQALPNLALARVRYISLKNRTPLDAALKSEIETIDKELAEAFRLGRSGEARRLIAKGLTRLARKPWTEELDFTHSLVLRSDRVFVDSTRPYRVRIEQIYSPAIELTSSLDARAVLRKPASTSRPGAAAGSGEIVKDLGSFDGIGRDLRESPFPLDVILSGLEDGRRVIDVTLADRDRALGTVSLAVELRKGLDARLERIEREAQRVEADGLGELRADIAYPADYIRRADRGLIEFGTFDVEKELTTAEAVLAAAKARKDPFAGRTGDFERHHALAAAGEIMPYRVYVPRAYTGKAAFPLIVALHGLGATEDSFFDSYSKRLPVLAEQHGFILAAPLGYRVDGFYGSGLEPPPADAAQRRKQELSEADVMAILDLMKARYRIDESRVYLMGHSMGAIGTWRLGAKYPEIWAALGCFAGRGVPSTVERMKHIPQFVVHGDADPTVPVEGSRAMVAEMKRLGVDHQYVEVPKGNHIDVVEPNFEAMFKFFNDHRRKAARPTNQASCATPS